MANLGFSWIEAFKKIVSRYERYEQPLPGLVHLACSAMMQEYWDDLIHMCLMEREVKDHAIG